MRKIFASVLYLLCLPFLGIMVSYLLFHWVFDVPGQYLAQMLSGLVAGLYIIVDMKLVSRKMLSPAMIVVIVILVGLLTPVLLVAKGKVCCRKLCG